MKNRGFKECYTPLNHSLNNKAFVSFNINNEDNNFYLRIPIFSPKNKVDWSYDLIFCLNREQDDNSYSTMYPFGLRDNLCRKFEIIPENDFHYEQIKMVDIDGYVKIFNFDSDIPDRDGKKYIAKDGTTAYWFYELDYSNPFHPQLINDFSYCPDEESFYYYDNGYVEPSRINIDEENGIFFDASVDSNEHITLLNSSSGAFKLTFDYDNQYVSNINVFFLENNDPIINNQYKLSKKISFSQSQNNSQELTISFYEYDNQQVAVFQHSVTIHFKDSSNIFWIQDNSTSDRLLYHFMNDGKCDYFYKCGTNYNISGDLRFSLQYYQYLTKINDARGNWTKVYYYFNQLPYLQVDNFGLAIDIKCDEENRISLYTSRPFSIKSRDRVDAEENLIKNGFFYFGINNWTLANSQNPIYEDTYFLDDYEVICVLDAKISQIINYNGLPDEEFFFACFVKGCLTPPTNSIICCARITLVDYYGVDIESFSSNSIFFNANTRPECISFSFKSSAAFSSIRVEIGTDDTNQRAFYIGSVQLFRGDSSISTQYNNKNQPFSIKENKEPKIMVTNKYGQPFIYLDSQRSIIYGDYINEATRYRYGQLRSDYSFSQIKDYVDENIITTNKINNVIRNSYSKQYKKGYLINEKSNNNIEKQYSYNSSFNLIEEENVLSGLEIDYGYECIENGLLSSVVFDGGSNNLLYTISFTFNNQRQISSFSSEFGQFTYSYSSSLLPQSMSLNSATIVTYSYNEYNDVVSKKYGNETFGYNFSFDDEGKLNEILYNNNLIHSLTYDECKRLGYVYPDNYSYNYINNEIYEASMNGTSIKRFSESKTGFKIEYNLFTKRTIDYSWYTYSSQYLYMSKNYQVCSIFAQTNLSFVIFGLSNFIYSSNDETLLTMHGKYYVPSSEYTSIDGITLINYSGLNYKVLQSKSTYGNQSLPFTKALCYGWNCPYQDGNQGETIGGYFNFSQLEYGNFPTFFMFLTNSSHTESIGLKVENNYIYCVVSGNGGSSTDIVSGMTISTNTWYYISLSAYFEDNYLRKIRIRINDKVSFFNYNLSSPYSNDETNTIRFVSFFGINDNIAPSGASCQTMDGYSLCLFISPNHKYLSDDEERSVYITAKTAFFDTNFDDHKRISSSVFMKKQTPYPLTIISKKHIPLCNSFVSLEGDRPVLAKHNHELNLYNNSTFRFNELSHQYSYYACGYDLAYQNINVITGFSISLNINLDNINTSNPRYIFEIKNTSNSLGVYVQNGTIYCKYNNNNPIQLCTVSSIGDNRFSFYYVIPFRPHDVPGIGYYSNNESNFISISSFNGINGGLISFGRKLEEETLVDGTKTSYPLYGFIDSVAMANVDGISETRDENSNIGLVKKNYIENFETQKNSDEIYIDNSLLSERTIDVTTSTSDTNPGLPKSEYFDLSTSNGFLSNYEYDSCHRLSSVTRGNSSDGETFINQTVKTYIYDAFSRLTGYNINNSNKPKTYLYDSHGNITHIKENLTNKKVLTYDSLNRLTKEGNSYNFRYESSNPFNITFFGTSFLNDEVGNYFSYQGRLLTDITVTDAIPFLAAFPEMHFIYDYKVRRTRKTVGGMYNKIHSYVYDDDKLTLEIIFESDFQTVVHEIKYFYDEKGILSYMEIDDSSKYFYYIDSFSNIVGLYDENGVMVVRYEYDPWGNVESIVDNSNINLSTLNPFLYKGYYYEHESKMYYCHSRYYVPRWMRWLTIDDVSNINLEVISGSNLYAYCNNNPVMLIDKNGFLSETAIIVCAFVALFLLGFLFSMIHQDLEYGTENVDEGSIVQASFVGLFSGLTVFFVNYTFFSIFIGLFGNAFEYALDSERHQNYSDESFAESNFQYFVCETSEDLIFSLSDISANIILDILFEIFYGFYKMRRYKK